MSPKIAFSIVSLSLLLTIFGYTQQPKYALALYHFNLQYVAGDQRIERRIIRESVIPLLDFYEANPSYKGDFEIQAWGLEVIYEEFPEVFARLAKLLARGQLELVVAHYSDQLYIGYPALDMQKSVELSDEILAKLGLKRSRVFLGQEIQWTPAIASALTGQYDIICISADPYGYYRPGAMPLMKVTHAGKEMLVLAGGGRKDLDWCQWTWAFFDDGEVFSTKDYDSDFFRVPEWEKQHIDRFRKLAKEGYQFVTISEFVDILSKGDYQIPDMPYIPEGTWNMGAGGPYNWLGRQRGGNEKDGLTRARNFLTRDYVLAAESLVKELNTRGQQNARATNYLKQAWKYLLLSEVSDSSGWGPLPIEVRYTDEHAEIAERAAREAIAIALNALKLSDKRIEIDTHTAKIRPLDDNSKTHNPQIAPLPITMQVRAKSYTIAVEKWSQQLYKVTATARRPADAAVEFTFPLTGKEHYYCAPLGEETLVKVPDDLNHDPILALSNGLFTLGDGWNLVKDNHVEHLAATWKYKSNKLVFREELRRDIDEANMVFYLYAGSKEQALTIANRLNTWPILQVSMTNGVEIIRVLPEDFCESTKATNGQR